MTDSTAQTSTNRKPIRAPHGTTLSCKGWGQEAALRMLMNSLDPEVAEHPENLIVHGIAKIARNWDCYDAIVAALRALENNETLLVRSGKPVGILRTREDTPRLLIASTNMAGNWMYTGTQGILQITYETFAAATRKHFGGDLAGKLVVSGGMGAMGGAQPLAATLNGAAFLGIDVDAERIKLCVKAGYCDVMVNNLDESLRILKNAVRKRDPASVGLVGNCAELIPALAERGIVPDLLTDQTPASDPVNNYLGYAGQLGYVPRGLDVAAAAELRRRDPDEYRRRAVDSIAAHVRGMLDLQKLGAMIFDFGNNIHALALGHGVKDSAYDAPGFPGFVPEYIQPLLSEGRGPFLWVALSGEPSDIYRTEEIALEMFPQDETLTRWIRLARKRVRFQGLPARTCWLDREEAVKFGLALNNLVAHGASKAPIAIGRELFDFCASSDATSDWALLSAMLNAASGASWVSIQSAQSGGAGIGYWQHAGQSVVADGTPEMAARIERVLTTDSSIEAVRLADAG